MAAIIKNTKNSLPPVFNRATSVCKSSFYTADSSVQKQIRVLLFKTEQVLYIYGKQKNNMVKFRNLANPWIWEVAIGSTRTTGIREWIYRVDLEMAISVHFNIILYLRERCLNNLECIHYGQHLSVRFFYKKGKLAKVKF